jgi:hypothetical protein
MNKKSASASMQKRFFYSLPASDSDRSFSTTSGCDRSVSTAAGSSADPPYPSSPAQSPATACLCLPG